MTPVQMALRETAQQLRKQGRGPVAQYADKASEQVERFSGYLREMEVDEMVDEVRGFARSRPALFLGSAALAGFLSTRFLKSSSQGGASAGQGSDTTGTAISSATVTHGTGEPATALPPCTVAGSPTARRTPMSGQQPLSEGDRPQTPGSFRRG